MKRTILTALLVAGLAGSGFAAPDDTATLRKMADDFAAAWNRNDAAALAAFWAPDGDLINPFGRHASGSAAVLKLFQDEHAGPMKGTRFTVDRNDLRLIGADSAVMDWTVTISGMQGPDGKAGAPLQHHVTVVLVKKAGKWLVAAGRPFLFAPPPPGMLGPAGK